MPNGRKGRILRTCLVIGFKYKYRNSLLEVSLPASRSLDSSAMMILLRLAIKVVWDLPWSSLLQSSVSIDFLAVFYVHWSIRNDIIWGYSAMGKLPVAGSLSLLLNNVQYWTNLLNCLYYQHRFLTADNMSNREQAFFYNSLSLEFFIQFPHWYVMGRIIPLFLFVLREKSPKLAWFFFL